MIKDKKVIVVMPAYNAAKTLLKTYEEVMDNEIVDLVIIVDDASNDDTINIAKTLKNVKIHIHEKNKGYGGNQKSCYNLALEEGGDIIIMVHPDYQYTPKLIPAMAGMIEKRLYHCVLGSRILGGETLKGGMPLWKYIINRMLTEIENFILGANLSEYHTGYRAFSKELLSKLPMKENSNGFIFDNEILAEILWLGYPIGEISCPTHYFPEASSINLWNSIKYGLGIFKVAFTFRLSKMGLIKSPMFPQKIRQEKIKISKGIKILNESTSN